jgi:hypothetical protein
LPPLSAPDWRRRIDQPARFGKLSGGGEKEGKKMERADWSGSLKSLSDSDYLKVQRSPLGIRSAYYRPVEPQSPVTKSDRNWLSALSGRNGLSKTVRKGNPMATMTKTEAQTFKTQSVVNTASVDLAITSVCGCEAYKDVFTYGRWGAQGFAPKKGQTAHSVSTLVEKEGQKPYWHTAKLFCRHQVQEIKEEVQEPKAPAKKAAAKRTASKKQTPAPKAAPQLDIEAIVRAVIEQITAATK